MQHFPSRNELIVEGRFPRADDHVETTAVFDKGRATDMNPMARAVLQGAAAPSRDGFFFYRRPNDSRPGRPVPCGEPHPDRLAIAEAIRQQIMAREAKWKLPDGLVATDAKGNYKRGEERQRRSTGKTPDIAEPLGPYTEPETVVIIATRHPVRPQRRHQRRHQRRQGHRARGLRLDMGARRLGQAHAAPVPEVAALEMGRTLFEARVRAAWGRGADVRIAALGPWPRHLSQPDIAEDHLLAIAAAKALLETHDVTPK